MNLQVVNQSSRWRALHWAVLTLLALSCLFFALLGIAQAQTGPQILIVTTNETTNALGRDINSNAIKEFTSNAPANATIITRVLSSDTTAIDYTGYDIVVLSAVFADINVANRTAISNAVLNKSSNAFVFFVDSCGSCSATNASWFLQLVKDNATTFTPEQGAEVTGNRAFPLNTSSPYSTSFESVPTISGAFFKPFTGVPVDFILYKETGAELTAPTGNAMGMLLPLGEAKGSCTFATTDSSMFDSTVARAYQTNAGKIAPAFYAAATGGSCFATVQQADLSVSVASSVISITESGEVIYTVTVENAGGDEAVNPKVDISLDSGLTFQSGEGCSTPAGIPVCSLENIASGGTSTFTFTAVANPGTRGKTLKATASVSSDTADPQLANNRASDVFVTITSQGDVHIFTPDGLIYDFQSVGEFIAVRSIDEDNVDNTVIVQARQEPWARNPRVSINTAVAFMVGDVKLEFYVLPDASFQLNDGPQDLPSSRLPLPNGGSVEPLSVSDTRLDYVINWPDGGFKARVVLWKNSHLDYGVARQGGSQTYEGLLGNLDGNAQNDLQIQDGEQIQPPPSLADLNRFGESWRVPAGESMFDNAEAVDDGSDNPVQPLTMQEIPETERQQAQGTCQEAGITESTALRNCTYDVAVTGDQVFVESAKVLEETTKDLPPSAKVPAQPGETSGGAIFDADQAGLESIMIMDGDDVLITTGTSEDGTSFLRFNIYRDGIYVVGYSLATDADVADAVAGAIAGPVAPVEEVVEEAAAANDPESTVCFDAVQGKIAWNYDGATSWNSGNVTNLCSGAESSIEPALCFEQVMFGDVNHGGGTEWRWQDASSLCQGTWSASNTIECFVSAIDNGESQEDAIASCRS